MKQQNDRFVKCEGLSLHEPVKRRQTYTLKERLKNEGKCIRVPFLCTGDKGDIMGTWQSNNGLHVVVRFRESCSSSQRPWIHSKSYRQLTIYGQPVSVTSWKTMHSDTQGNRLIQSERTCQDMKRANHASPGEV